MRNLSLSLTAPQAEFATSPAQFPAIVAGFGAGKTEAGCARLLIKKVINPRSTVAFYAPSYDLVMKGGWPRIEALLDEHKLSYKTNKNEKIIAVRGYGLFMFRTMENPASLISYEHADALVDELDTLKAAHAEAAWDKILSRNRQIKQNGDLNTIGVSTTPEGFRFVYDRWKKKPMAGSALYKASTYSNQHNLAVGYIESMAAKYTPSLLLAYVMGEFVNLASGSVYPDFDRVLNGSTATINAGESLHIGMDFNINKMAAVTFVIRDRLPIAVGEFAKIRDTPAMAEVIRTRYGKRHPITIYPDASGQNPSSKNASVTDLLLLRQAGFNVNALSSNPPVRDRVTSVNALILNAAGQRRLKVNVDACPNFTECLEQQVYDASGEPDKKGDKDHHNDGAGYFLYRLYPSGRTVAPGVQILGL